MVVFPNIKINLGLNILQKRSDGYHDIETVMVGVDWCDVLEIVPSNHSNDNLTVTGYTIDCPPEKNLVMKAVKAMRALFEQLPAVDIFLHKNVPDGAGLGGGSSNAAFTILALNKLFDLGLDKQKMCEIASGIGSDCPFFIYNEPMLATGRGELLTPVAGIASQLREYCIAIVKPCGVSVSTAAAYAGVTPQIPEQRISDVLSKPIKEWKYTLENAFEHSIFALTKQPEDIKRRLYDIGAIYASMSGSGSAVYGIFETNNVNSRGFKNLFPNTDVHIGCPILN